LFEACWIVCVFYVDCKANEVIDVDVNGSSCVNWDVNDEFATHSERDVVWKEFLGWDMLLGVCGVKREWVPINVMDDCID
jgi:hypothetical protein